MKQSGLAAVFDRLYGYYGPQGWWPGDTRIEICVGAILTQNTSWQNVERAICALKGAGLLSMEGLVRVDPDQLAQLIRPAGYYNLKSKRLKSFLDWIGKNFDGSFERMFAGEWQMLRNELLKCNGIGPETCDSILLYAGGKPTFVVDSYTRRLFYRLGFLPEDAGYDQTRDLFMEQLPPDSQLYNEYHALIVAHCKQFCTKKTACQGCLFLDACKFFKI
jgi:endonuclease-3 related protein